MRIAVLIALADDKDLVFTEFQLFLRPEGSNGSGKRSDKAGSHRNTQEYVAFCIREANCLKAKANVGFQPCAADIGVTLHQHL